VVLESIERFEPDSPYLITRRVMLKADQQAYQEVIRNALKIMRLPYDVGDWCRANVWRALNEQRQLPALIQAAIQAWGKGAVIEPNFFKMMIEDIERVWPPPGKVARGLQTLKVDSTMVKRLKELLPRAMASDNPEGSYTASILSKLEDHGRRRFVIAFAKKNEAFARSRTQVWQIVGHALVIGSASELEQARKWLQNWRLHDGCDFWVISNYIIAIEHSPKLKANVKFQMIMETADEAVRALEGDGTSQFVICKYCEAALRSGNTAQFLSWVDQYNNILADGDSGYWTSNGSEHLAWLMLQFKALLKAEPEKVAPISKRFKNELKRRNVPDWAAAEWKRQMKTIRRRRSASP